jgi:hypothetical protein
MQKTRKRLRLSSEADSTTPACNQCRSRKVSPLITVWMDRIVNQLHSDSMRSQPAGMFRLLQSWRPLRLFRLVQKDQPRQTTVRFL